MRIAICGGTISGATLARTLSSSSLGNNVVPFSIELHSCLHDPARSKPHPLCEYEPLSFLISENAESDIKKEVNRWVGEELIQLCSINGENENADGNSNNFCPSPRMGVYDSKTNLLSLEEDNSCNLRYQPRRGFFSLIDRLLEDLPTSKSESCDFVRISKDQLSALERNPRKHSSNDTDPKNDNQKLQQQQHQPNHQWFLRGASDTRHGPYDLVLFAYDANPRSARKASFKQLLETALPTSSEIIKSLSRTVSASAMTAIVAFPKRKEDKRAKNKNDKSKSINIPFDSVRFEGVPALQFATRNRSGDAASHRGLRFNIEKEDVWTLVATPEWSHEVRKSHSKKWNKKAVGTDIVTAFASTSMSSCHNSEDTVNSMVEQHRSLVPTFHWQGSSSISRTAPDTDAFSFDAEAGIGFCGDVFGGQGVEGAIRSAKELAQHIQLYQEETSSGISPYSLSRLPVDKTAWTFRSHNDHPDRHDTNSIVGEFTGRDEPRDGLDHTWPTAVDIVNGKVVESADSLAKYRRRNSNVSNKSRNNKGGKIRSSNSSNENNNSHNRNRIQRKKQQ
eukprot:CAMPEP_0194294466 /NCGR_PEP_ID=MMETSP0169-20130528/50719_1 /TAXON_ID=218684 /ORGANISM="Corethron pennatum, Strain L29A3" /LENGTH=563 /DNA_ID=CAMNT_0039043325 /DNA_START=111 /DNA_END=1802 /DNA_ORIENTATION=-